MSRFLVTTQKQIKEKDSKEDLYKIGTHVRLTSQVVEFENDNPTWEECNDLMEEYGIIIMMQRLEDEE